MAKTIALDISTTKVGIAVFDKLTCIDCTVVFLSSELLENKAQQFIEITKGFFDKYNNDVDIIAYESPLLFIRGASTANVVTKLASFNLLVRWLVWQLFPTATLLPVPIATYKSYFNKTVFTAQELADNTIANLSASKMYNLAVVNRLFKQHAPNEVVTNFLTSKNSRGGAAKGVDDAADAIVVGFYSVLHDGRCQPRLPKPKRKPAKRVSRPVRRSR